jgi:hypothetical protein
LDEKISVSRQQAEIIRRAIDKIVDELNRIGEVHADLLARKDDAIKAVVSEASATSYANWSQAVENMRQSMIEITGLEKFLAGASGHDYLPDQRIIVTLPIYGCIGGEIVANAVQIAGVEAQLKRFAETLAADPRAPAPEISIGEEVDQLTYDRLSPGEKRAADAAFSASGVQTTERETPDSRSFATQIRDAAKAALGIHA